MKRLLLDQGLPRSTGALLAQAGWDVTHVSEIGMSRADDIDILQRARAEQRVCVTLDADFHALLATSGERGPSVTACGRKVSSPVRSPRCYKACGQVSRTQ